jgi:hypothetical protein
MRRRVDGVNVTHQHPALPKTAEEAWGVMHALEGDGSEDGIAVSEAIPVVVPACTRSELRTHVWR